MMAHKAQKVHDVLSRRQADDVNRSFLSIRFIYKLMIHIRWRFHWDSYCHFLHRAWMNVGVQMQRADPGIRIRGRECCVLFPIFDLPCPYHRQPPCRLMQGAKILNREGKRHWFTYSCLYDILGFRHDEKKLANKMFRVGLRADVPSCVLLQICLWFMIIIHDPYVFPSHRCSTNNESRFRRKQDRLRQRLLSY